VALICLGSKKTNWFRLFEPLTTWLYIASHNDLTRPNQSWIESFLEKASADISRWLDYYNGLNQYWNIFSLEFSKLNQIIILKLFFLLLWKLWKVLLFHCFDIRQPFLLEHYKCTFLWRYPSIQFFQRNGLHDII